MRKIKINKDRCIIYTLPAIFRICVFNCLIVNFMAYLLLVLFVIYMHLARVGLTVCMST